MKQQIKIPVVEPGKEVFLISPCKVYKLAHQVRRKENNDKLYYEIMSLDHRTAVGIATLKRLGKNSKTIRTFINENIK